MTELGQLPSIEGLALTARTNDDPGGLVLRFAGEADMNAIRPLGEYLAAVHEIAVARGVRQVRVDMGDLRFMNSSCLRELVIWVTRIQQLAADRRYGVTFVPNAQRPAQKWSLAAIRALAEDLVTIEGG